MSVSAGKAADSPCGPSPARRRRSTTPLDAWVRRTDGTVKYLPELSDGNAAARRINRFGTISG